MDLVSGLWQTIMTVINWFIHIDDHLAVLLQEWGWMTYIILILIIFAETGLVVMPFTSG